MNRYERFEDLDRAVQTAIMGQLVETWTAMPGIIQSFNAVAQTAVVQPAIKGKVSTSAGTTVDVIMPLLLDCPIVFPQGGGFSLTFPVAEGDECLVVFGCRCIDAWWQQGGVQPQAEIRFHDLSDGFAIVGVRSQPRVVPSYSATATELRSDDGTIHVSLNHAAGTLALKAPTSITLDAPTTYITGLIAGNTSGGPGGVSTLNGSLHTTGDVVAEGTSAHSHVHINGGGTGNSGPPA